MPWLPTSRSRLARGERSPHARMHGPCAALPILTVRTVRPLCVLQAVAHFLQAFGGAERHEPDGTAMLAMAVSAIARYEFR